MRDVHLVQREHTEQLMHAVAQVLGDRSELSNTFLIESFRVHEDEGKPQALQGHLVSFQRVKWTVALAAFTVGRDGVRTAMHILHSANLNAREFSFNMELFSSNAT